MKLQNVLIAGALLYGTVYGLYGNVELIPRALLSIARTDIAFSI